MSNTYSVKSSGEMGMLKLKLTRDPRASRVKSPLRQASLVESSNKRTPDKTHPAPTSPPASKSTAAVSSNSAKTSMIDSSKSSQTHISPGSHNKVKSPKLVDKTLLQSVLKHVADPKKAVKKTQPSVKTGSQSSVKASSSTSHSSSKVENALLQSITQNYATLESFLAKSSLHKTKPTIPSSSHSASRPHTEPVKSQIMIVPHSAQSSSKPLNPLATVILSNPVKSSSFKPAITVMNTAPVKPHTNATSTKITPPQSSKTVAMKPSVPSSPNRHTKPAGSASGKASYVKRNAISPSSTSLPKAKKAKVQSTSLPASRVRTIMKTNVKSSHSSLNISQESVQVVGRATELFIAELVKCAHKATLESAQNEVTYNHLARAVHKSPDEMRFLHDILPEKVKLKDYLTSLKASSPAARDD